MPKNTRSLQIAWLLLCGAGAVLPAVADAIIPSTAPFIVDSWSNEEGLPQSSVISVIQTRDGYLWLGTLRGLVRFDGIHFTVFDENNTPGLDSSRIVFLFEDSRGNLWVGTDTGSVAMMQDGRITNFATARAGHEARLVYAYEDPAGIVWFYTADGRTSWYQNGKMQSDPALVSLELFRRATRTWVPGQSGAVWFIQNGRVQKGRNNRVERDFGVYPWRTNTIVTSAFEDRDGNFVVGTLGDGVFWYDAAGNPRPISKAQGLSSPFILSLCMDREGNLWVGTDGGGLDRIRRNVFSAPEGLRPLVAQSVSEDEHGGLWVAFNASGVSYWNTNSVQDFGVGRNSSAWTVLVDRKQQIRVGTQGEGLFQFYTNEFRRAPGADILEAQIFALFEDHSGQLWAGTQNGLARWNGEDWRIYSTKDGLSENIVRAIAEDARGNLWIGTEGSGLSFFNTGKFISYRKETSGLPGNDISALYVDKDDFVWIGTSGHGLARFHDGKWSRYSERDGLASNSISYIIEDDAGNLWIGSNAGLMRISKKSLNDVANGTTNTISCRTYTKTDGLPTRECTMGSQPAAIRAHDGRLWFSTVKGLVSVNPTDLRPNPYSPPVMIESVQIDHVEQNTNKLRSGWLRSVTVPPGKEFLDIQFTSLALSAPARARFKYRLEGHETAWTEIPAPPAGEAPVARYSNLRPDSYRFQVTACNEDGVWNDAGAVLEITVLPQFWQTGWFRAAAILCFLGLIVGGVRYLSTQKLQRQLQLLKHHEELERERSRIARDLHDQLGANLTQVALLSEMAEADRNSPAEIEAHAQQISQTARETTRSLDEIVWAVNPSNDTLEGLINYACNYAQDYLALAGLRYRVDVPDQLPAITIPPEVRHNVFLAFKEAVHNVVKHAQASEVRIRLRLHKGDAVPPSSNFALEIEDNGRGIGSPDANAVQTRNGLRNMRKRMEDIHGGFWIGAGTTGGTTVRLTAPIRMKNAE